MSYPVLRTLTLEAVDRKDGTPSDRVTAILSTEELGRDGAIVRAAGWDLRQYRRNPVVLFAHDDRGGLPIARGENVRVEGQRLIGDAVFDTEDPAAALILGKVQRGFLNATSVRWRPLKVSEQQVNGQSVVVFERQELLEFSFVSVPADAFALVVKRADGSALALKDLLRGPVAVHHTATDKAGSWDGADAVGAMPSEPGVLGYCHAWADPEGDPEAHRSYKFPHHRTGGGPAVIAAVNNALARLNQADIPEGDRAGVERHLRAHRDDAGLEASYGGLEAVMQSVTDLMARQRPSLVEYFIEGLARRTGKAPDRLRHELGV